MQYKSHIELKDYIDIVFRRYLLIIQAVVIFTIVTAVYNYFLKPVYITSATLMIRKPVSSISTTIFYELDLIGSMNQKATYLRLLNNRTILSNAAKKIIRDPKEAQSVVSRIRITDMANTKLITVSLTGHDPQKITLQVNEIARAIVEHTYDSNMKTISNTEQFIEKQLNEIGRKLIIQEEEIKDFKIKSGVEGLTNRTSVISSRISNYQTQIDENNLKIRKLNILLSGYKLELSKISEHIEKTFNVSENPEYEKYKMQVGQKRMELEGISAVFGKKHPKFKKVYHELAYLEEELKKSIKEEVKSFTKEKNPYYAKVYENYITAGIEKSILVDQNEALPKKIKLEKENLLTLPVIGLSLERMQREFRVNERIYQLIKEKHSETQIAQTAKEKLLDVVAEATLPTSPIRPMKLKNISIAFISGLGFGFILVFIMEFFDQSIKSPVEIKEHIAYNMLGVIPEIKTDHEKIPEGIIMNPFLIMGYDFRSSASENIRALRTNIDFAASSGDYPKKSLMITNSSKGEGKSFIISNIAISFASAGKKVLLIDSDLRRSKLHLYFGILNTDGLTNILLGDSIGSNIRKTIFEGLDIITSGPLPPNPSELISTGRMSEIIEECEKEYDYVLIDAPPVTAVTDAQLLASQTDGILFLISLYSDSMPQVNAGLELIEKVNGKILGVVCNRVKETAFYKAYYSYYKYDSYSS
ncbi:polysaccharide biosynthesis tyrosine autokinase [bacterium]|nr:polysaccharide biosynthesis tyrosine autokinase [bacterium]